MLNINKGHNRKLMETCKTLHDYAEYTSRVREYAAEMSLDEAVERAIIECISEGILADFLSRNRTEVINMSIFEYDKELEEKKLRKAEFEAGFTEGEKQGHETGFAEGKKQGHETGFAEGEKQGHETGFAEGALLNSIETARRMLRSGKFSLEEIADFSGLPLEEIKKLVN